MAGQTGGGGPGTPGTTSAKWNIQVKHSDARVARTAKIREIQHLTSASIYDLGLDAADALRSMDPATAMALRAARSARELLAGFGFAPWRDPDIARTTRGRCDFTIRPDPDRIARTAKIKDLQRLTASEIYDLGLDAADAKRDGDPATEFSQHLARLARDLLSLYDYAPWADPDEERELDKAFLDGRSPAIRRNARPLRTGLQRRPVRMRPPQQ